ncbi:MAG TPA: RNA polymerase sigma factor [Ktedonobacteraceae bacterium]|nr:RNA polymerase sigma factor [Ktedonobacteraceae bacterium]
MPEPDSDASASATLLADDESTLAEAVRRARAGDHAAFEYLYQRYKALIWKRLTYFVGEREVVYDLFQETFLRAWQKLAEMGQDVPFEWWLKRIAANIAIDHLRREKKLLFLPLPDDESENQVTSNFPSAAGPEAQLDMRESIQQALRQMSPQNRACVLLQDAWGFSQHEIANMLNISEKSVSAYISRGREQLRQVYTRLIAEPQRTNEGETGI